MDMGSKLQVNHKIERTLSPFQHVLASTAGGVMTALFVTPFDVVKTRLQAQFESSKLLPSHFRGTPDAFVKIVKIEGIRTLWRGLSAAIVVTVPATAFYFTSYERFKLELYRRQIFSLSVVPALAGLMARTLTVMVIAPFELLRTNVQSTAKVAHVNENLLPMLAAIVKRDGVYGLWRGIGLTLLRDVPFSAIYWTGYEKMKTLIYSKTQLRGFTADFLSGAISGFVASCLTTPMDVVKTRQQMYREESAIRKSYPMGATAIVRKILAEEGARGLVKGIVPRAVKVAPACAIMISSYELFKNILSSS